MSEQYNCPKCSCGCLFENKNKLICLNCGAEVSPRSAVGVRHEHSYRTYTARTVERPMRTSGTAERPVVRTSSAPVRTFSSSRPKKKKKRGFLFWVFLYLLVSWLVQAITRLS